MYVVIDLAIFVTMTTVTVTTWMRDSDCDCVSPTLTVTVSDCDCEFWCRTVNDLIRKEVLYLRALMAVEVIQNNSSASLRSTGIHYIRNELLNWRFDHNPPACFDIREVSHQYEYDNEHVIKSFFFVFVFAMHMKRVSTESRRKWKPIFLDASQTTEDDVTTLTHVPTK
jgi:hypothetical protein